jgi:hypothetical protein
MFCPRVGKVVEPFPKRGKHPLDHELADNAFVEIFRPDIYPVTDEVAPVNVFFFHTPFAFLYPCDSVFLELAGLPLLFALSPCLETARILVIVPADSEERQIRSAASSVSRRKDRDMSGLWHIWLSR